MKLLSFYPIFVMGYFVGLDFSVELIAFQAVLMHSNDFDPFELLSANAVAVM